MKGFKVCSNKGPGPAVTKLSFSSTSALNSNPRGSLNWVFPSIHRHQTCWVSPQLRWFFSPQLIWVSTLILSRIFADFYCNKILITCVLFLRKVAHRDICVGKAEARMFWRSVLIEKLWNLDNSCLKE
jgi:hypothetical protein